MNPLHDKYTSQEDFDGLAQGLRTVFSSGKTKSYSFRIAQLKALHTLVKNEEKLIVEALAKDLGRCQFEAGGLEVLGLMMEIEQCINNLSSWMEPVTTPVSDSRWFVCPSLLISCVLH